MRIFYNPPPDKEGTSALHGAVQAGRTALVRYLLEKGATPELLDANGKSRSICSISGLLGLAPVEHEAEAEFRRPVRPGLMRRGAEPEVAAAVLAEPSTPRLQPRFAHCCGTQR